MNTSQIRKNIRQQRRSLSILEQYQHQQAVLKHLMRSGLLRRHQRIAIYLDSDGELATGNIIKRLLKMKKQVFLPVLFPFAKNKLWFFPYTNKTRLIKNRFDIAEPKLYRRRITPSSITLIFMPLVGFDEQGNRIGMGGGFYDRTLSHCKTRTKSKLPMLVGLAHELQKVNNIEKRSWDIPLNNLLTDKKIRKYSKALT